MKDGLRNGFTRGFTQGIVRFAALMVAASVIIFVLLRAVPGDPARIALGVTATEEAVKELAARLGTDRPLIIQYFDWVKNMLTGNFGIPISSTTAART